MLSCTKSVSLVSFLRLHPISALIVLFFVIRLVSFFLQGQEGVQALICLLLATCVAVLWFKKPQWSCTLVVGEMLLGGAGHFFEFFGLSLRVVLLVTLVLCFLITSFRTRTFPFLSLTNIQKITGGIFLGFLAVAAILGLLSGHEERRIVQDLLPYSFLLLVLPLTFCFKTKQDFLAVKPLLVAFLVSTAIWSLFLLFTFSFDIFEIHEPFYNWFRDIAAGKITDTGTGFFRIIAPEHLLIVPIFLVILSWNRMLTFRSLFFVLTISSIIILSINLSRAYFLGLVVGLIVLKWNHSWLLWTKKTILTLTLIGCIFTSLHLIVSTGKSFGWELFGVRLLSFVETTIEESTANRMLLLPPIIEKIRQQPILGQGLGAVITYTHPVTHMLVTTPHFDWGYLEMWVELGLVGSLFYLLLISSLLLTMYKQVPQNMEEKKLLIGFFAAIISLLIVNITTPALFHVFGIFLLVSIYLISHLHSKKYSE